MLRTLLLKIYSVLLFVTLFLEGVSQNSINQGPEIIAPTTITVSADDVDSVSCNGGSDGVAIASAGGGVGNYTYTWSTGAVGDTLSGVSAGTYYVTAEDSNACTIVDSVVIHEPDSLLIVLDQFYDVSCYEQQSGAIYITFTGGNGGVSYLWSTGDTNLGIFSQDTGWYSVTITDSKGCQDSASYYIDQPDTSVHVASAIVTDANCYGGENGSILLTPSGGTAGYTYAWNTGHDSSFVSGLGEGTYIVTITDANNCAHDTSFSITQPGAPDSALITIQNINCHNDSTGELTAQFNGGTSPYFYFWSNGENTATISNLGPGSYMVSAFDVEGCTQVKTATISEPADLIVTTSVVDSLLCFGDSNGVISSSIIGGVTPYTFVWNTGSFNDSLIDIPAGDYFLAVLDGNGCEDTSTITLGEPPQLAFNVASANDVSCNGSSDGVIITQLNGGTEPYAYAWSNGATSSAISQLPPGTYTLTFSDGNGCSSDTSFVVGEPDSLHAVALIVDSANCINTSDGSITTAAVGGTPPYSTIWNMNFNDTIDTLSDIPIGGYFALVFDQNFCSATDSVYVPYVNELPIAGLQSDTTFCNTFSGMIAADPSYAAYLWSSGDTVSAIQVAGSGLYFLTVTSAEGCSSVDSIDVNFTNSTPMTLGNDTVICLDDGTASYTLKPNPLIFSNYLWNTGDTFSTLNVSASGMYSLIVENSAGCPSTDTIIVVFDTCKNIGLEEFSSLFTVSIYPNPTRTQFIIEWDSNPTHDVEYELYSALGKLVDSRSSIDRLVSLDLSKEASGVFTLSVRQGETVQHFRIVKQ